MSYQNNGGPMHPVLAKEHPVLADGEQWWGISARDYFAAQAPAVIPPWFTVTTATSAPVFPDPSELSEDDRALYNSAVRLKAGGGFWLKGDMPETVIAYFERFKQAEEQIKAYGRQQEAMRFFAWRWYYADMMLQMRCDPNVGVPQPQPGASL